MITLVNCVILLGFYSLYSTSKRADLIGELKLQKWLIQKPKIAKTIGCTLLLIALVVTWNLLGWGAGTFAYLVLLMTWGSLTVLISPLRFFSATSLVLIAVLMFILEFYTY